MEKPEFLQFNLKRLMDSKGWSIKKLAAESGASYHTVFRAVSKGITPRGSNLQKLATALGVRIQDLWANPSEKEAGTGPRLVTMDDLQASQQELLKAIQAVGSLSADEVVLLQAWRAAEQHSRNMALYALDPSDKNGAALHGSVRREIRHARELRALPHPKPSPSLRRKK